MQATRTVKLRCVKYRNDWGWGVRDSDRLSSGLSFNTVISSLSLNYLIYKMGLIIILCKCETISHSWHPIHTIFILIWNYTVFSKYSSRPFF